MNMGLRLVNKAASEMSPPSNSSTTKRRSKQSSSSNSSSENSLKRTHLAKTPGSTTSLGSSDKGEVVYNQGRWTSLEHFKFLEALKKFGKEWQKVQQHVSTRTSTQARSHAQKFFVKLDKKSLTLEEFLKGLDLKEVEKNLLASGMDNTDYDEEREVNIIASRKKGSSVMNIALPPNTEDKKRHESNKRDRSELENIDKTHSLNNIRKAFEEHSGHRMCSRSKVSDKRIKTSEYGEKRKIHGRDDQPISERTDAISKAQNYDEEIPLRKLSISNFEPVQPIYRTPQPDKNGGNIIDQFIFK
jgi:SHAQKYF class myb-like DNA-binding protein